MAGGSRNRPLTFSPLLSNQKAAAWPLFDFVNCPGILPQELWPKKKYFTSYNIVLLFNLSAKQTILIIFYEMTKTRKKETAMRFLTSFVSCCVLLAFSTPVIADNFGTSAEAKAMLEKAVVAIKANKADALAKFTKGEGGFKDRDLYPFCGGPDGNFTAHPSLVGKSLKDLKDKAGKALGQDIYATAKDGAIGEVSYMWPRPGTTEPVQKISYVTKVSDQVCAVGYYK
jgi:hypothetical protein